ncbi:MAG: ATP-binding cassette domain-containing protein [Methanocellales archaeon]|nr:ATP-binding cassette domain-containing protein [Methanocellales archaeon]
MIETDGLTKVFGDLVAVDHASISVEKGELFGLLGPNGAGKTTLISMLSTTLPPTSGVARVYGFDVLREPSSVRASIGVVFQEHSLDDRLTARENLDLHGRLYGMEKALRRKRMDEVLELVELSDRANDLVKTYSGGMMRRLEIARGLMHHPKVLFLDEPTLGLDPQTRVHIWDYIKKLNEEGATMILTTHYMDEADHLCDRIAIIDHGNIVALDTPENLKAKIRGDIISLEVGDGHQMEPLKQSMIKEDFVRDVSLRNNTLRLTVQNGERSIPPILSIAAQSGIKIQSVSLRKPTLDDVFIHHTGRAIREESASPMDRIKRRRRR